MNLDPTLLLVLTACLYIIVFGGLGLLRREGLSAQLAVESIVVTALVAGAGWLLNVAINPIFLIVALYVVTQRSRLVVDLANILVRRRNYPAAANLYRLALAWWPDAASRLIVHANLGAAQLFTGQVSESISTLQAVLRPENQRFLGRRCEAGARYNLGYAHEKEGDVKRAVEQYRQVIDLMPGSIYAQAAQSALKRRGKKEVDLS